VRSIPFFKIYKKYSPSILYNNLYNILYKIKYIHFQNEINSSIITKILKNVTHGKKIEQLFTNNNK